MLAGAAVFLAAAAHAAEPTADPAHKGPLVSELVVTASTENLLGEAVTASQGRITAQELELRPVFRVGQLFETVPGLVVTSHSGEGKANQYLLRGFNLDHGTDLAIFVDGMPVNERTHAHGQGYADLNFLIPELAQGLSFSKGPFYAAEGDFASVGAAHLAFVDSLPTQASVSAGTLNDQRLFTGGTLAVAGGARLLLAAEATHFDGPWSHPDDLAKANLAARLSGDRGAASYGVTALYYRAQWNATNDQPQRAVAESLIGRFGTLDPSDGGRAERFSLSASYDRVLDGGKLSASAYAIHNQLTLWNDFTHFLDDPVHGDQRAQDERRVLLGGALRYEGPADLLGRATDFAVGLQARYDDIYLDLRHTERRAILETLVADQVEEASAGLYAEATTHWADKIRTVLGARLDAFHARDENRTGGLSGALDQTLAQPKASLILGPWAKTEVYASAGQGFHSNDVRAGAGETPGTFVRSPFLVRSTGAELGLRTDIVPHVQAALSVFQLEFRSELTYDPDVGQTSAGRPGRRQGVELTAQYRPRPWLELNLDLASTRARYTDGDPAGPYIEDAPSFIGSAGVLVDDLGPWFGALELRDLGPHALISDNSERSPGYAEVNLEIGYKATPKLKWQLDVYNLTNSRDDAADYFYVDRLPGEPAEGRGDLHAHPLEPLSARLKLTALF
jgi:outer membrane receptor protein involved in Fe transport